MVESQLDRCCSLSYWLSADTSNGVWPNRHQNGIYLIIFRGDEGWSKLRILLRQVELRLQGQRSAGQRSWVRGPSYQPHNHRRVKDVRRIYKVRLQLARPFLPL